MESKNKERVFNIISYLFILVALIFFMTPLYWVITTSFKAGTDIFTIPPKLFRFEVSLTSWVETFQKYPVLKWLKNSSIISSGTTFLSLLLGIPAAYALSRFKIKGANKVSLIILGIRMLPPVSLLIPFYLIMRDLNLLGTYAAVILIDTALNLPFAIWLLKGYFDQLPIALEEAAMVDGASQFRSFISVTLPLATPGIITVVLFNIFYSWNDFIFALLLTNRATKTLPVGILQTFSAYKITWSSMSVISIITFLPVVLLSLYLQNYYVSGLTSGSIK